MNYNAIVLITPMAFKGSCLSVNVYMQMSLQRLFPSQMLCLK
jgi:hypothetical protein